jgi:ketosteroid isomerase-like protein
MTFSLIAYRSYQNLAPMLKSFTSSRNRLSQWCSLALTALAGGLMLGWIGTANAQTPASDTPPTELTNALIQIDAAANEGNLNAVMQFYSPDFTSDDGLTYDMLEEALKQFWERFSQVSYATELTNWQQEGDTLIVETQTTITGIQETDDRELSLNATITSRQRFVGGQIVHQEILSEQSQLTTGSNPPTVTVNLPETVQPGREFAFDAIVQEPLGDRYLMGAAIEEPAIADAYLNPAPIDLELLTAGGLFKIGRAPALPGDRWISSALVRADGMTLTTRRLRIVE